MSDPRAFERDPNLAGPRDFERDPNLARERYVEQQSAGASSGWIVAAVIAVVLLGLAAYSYRGTQVSSTTPETTTGQSTRAPVPSTPPASPMAPPARQPSSK
jgi:hypothetical protein